MIDKFKEFYDNNGKMYAEHRNTTSANIFHNFIEIPTIKELLPSDLTNKSVLDIGTGNGEYVSLLAPLAKHVTSIDISKTMIDIAQKNNPSFQNVTYVEGDVLEYKFDEKFDCIVGGFMLGYIESLPVLFKKLNNILTKNGTIVLSMLHPARTWGNMQGDVLYVDPEKDYWAPIHETDIGIGGAPIKLYRHQVSDIIVAASKNKLIMSSLREPVPIEHSLEADKYFKIPSVMVFGFER